MNITEHQELKILHNKNRIKQIKKTVVGLLQDENQKHGGEEDASRISKLPYIKKMELLEKLMKSIREPKFGLTLNDLAGAFYSDYFNPDEPQWDNGSRKARTNMRRLIKRVNKRHDGIDLVAIPYKDNYTGLFEHRFVNAFMSNELLDYRENYKRKIAEGFARIAEILEMVSNSKNEVNNNSDPGNNGDFTSGTLYNK